MIRGASLAGLLVSAVLSIALPIALASFWRRRTAAPWSIWWKGAALFSSPAAPIRGRHQRAFFEGSLAACRPGGAAER